MRQVNQLGIPDELTGCSQWVLWKVVERDGTKTKLPYQVNGSMAKSNDPETWASFDQVIKRYAIGGGWSGVGFVFSEEDPYCGIDLDGCRDPITGVVAEWAKSIILDFASYSEVSPSETGVKIWVKGGWPYDGNKHMLDTKHKIGDKAPAIEVYDRLRYFAVTGAVLKGLRTVEDRQDKLDALRAKFWKETIVATPQHDFRAQSSVFDRAKKYLEKMPVSVSGANGHGAAYTAACRMVIGFDLNESDAFALLADWNQACQPPWSEKELRHKINCALKESGERGYLRNVSPQNYDRVSIPKYVPPAPKHEPKVSTLQSAAARYIEQIKKGGDNLIDTGIPELDYSLGGGVARGELVLVCARPSHGKSAISLGMVHHWTLNGLPSLFVSEEMSALALGKRTIQFAADVPQEHWSTRIEHLETMVDEHFRVRAQCAVVENCMTAEAAAEAIRQAKKDFDIQCAVVDYAQLLGSPGRDRYQQVTNTSVCLRQVCSETQIVLVALCQLNRQIESRKVFQPVLSDIKETGQFEQDADVVVFAVWPHRIDPKHDPHLYTFYVAKNRNRAINQPVVSCRFEPSRQRFLESVPTEPEGGYFPSERPAAREWTR